MPDEKGSQTPSTNSDCQPLTPTPDAPLVVERVMTDGGKSESYKEEQASRKPMEKLHPIHHAGFWVQLILAVIGIAAILIYYGQLQELRRTNDLTQKALNAGDTTLSRTLDKMQGQVDAMNRLADKAGIQADKLDASVKQASRLVDATEKANANVLEADRPWLGGQIQITNFEVGKNPTITTVFTNSGKRPARLDVTVERSGFYVTFPFDPEAQFTFEERGSTSIVVPGGGFTLTSTVKGAALKQTDMDWAEGAHPIRTYFVFAKAQYRDLRTNEPHFTHVCIYYVARLKTPTDIGFRNCQEYNDAN